jgi:hypothetical protein
LGSRLDLRLTVQVHHFPPPGPPRNLRLYSRNNVNMVLQWEAPIFWGGCALVKYELEYRAHKRQGLGMKGP